MKVIERAAGLLEKVGYNDKWLRNEVDTLAAKDRVIAREVTDRLEAIRTLGGEASRLRRELDEVERKFAMAEEELAAVLDMAESGTPH